MVDENIYPTQDITVIFRKSNTIESIEYILAYLNLPIVFEWLKNNGIVKGNIVEFSEAPLSKIPFRRINWNDDEEEKIHNEITDKIKLYLNNKDINLWQQVQEIFNKLLKL